MLLTHADLADRERYLNARATLTTLLGLRVIPIINENDTVVTDEIKFGDNDTLGALVANLIEADALIILTDQSGLYTADPRKDAGATLVSEAGAGDASLESMAGGAGSHIGRGGMITKVLAAKRAARSGAHTVIASGHERDVLLRLLQGEAIGTLLTAPALTLAARKQWLADHLQVAGKLVLDAGAVKALRGEGKSLLPIGVKSVFGEFQRGAVVACVAEDGRDIARGLTNYNSAEARLIAQHAQQGDRGPARLRRRPRTHPQGQSGPAVIQQDQIAAQANLRGKLCRSHNPHVVIQQDQIAAQANMSIANVKLQSSGHSHNPTL